MLGGRYCVGLGDVGSWDGAVYLWVTVVGSGDLGLEICNILCDN